MNDDWDKDFDTNIDRRFRQMAGLSIGIILLKLLFTLTAMGGIIFLLIKLLG